MRPALFFIPFNLAPVSFAHLPVVVHTYPAVPLPMRAWVWRPVIVPIYPDIMIAIPAVISRDPHVAGFRGRTGMFHNHSGWTHANHDLRV